MAHSTLSCDRKSGNTFNIYIYIIPCESDPPLISLDPLEVGGGDKGPGKPRKNARLLYNIFQYPTGNFLSSTEFREFFPNFPKISNSGTLVSFSGLRRDGKWPVQNGGTETGPGSGCSRMLGMENFPDFCRKNPIPEKWHSGMQTSRGIPPVAFRGIHQAKP